jgi:hypothetical protein
LIDDILIFVAKICGKVRPHETAQFMKELDLAGMALQYFASGNPLINPLKIDKPIPVNMINAPDFHGHKRLCFDPRQNKYYLQVHVPEGTPPMTLGSCFKHSPPCGLRLRRPHLTCVHCMYRKRQAGKIPEYVPVYMYVTGIREGRWLAPLKDKIIKRLQEGIAICSD